MTSQRLTACNLEPINTLLYGEPHNFQVIGFNDEAEALKAEMGTEEYRQARLDAANEGSSFNGMKHICDKLGYDYELGISQNLNHHEVMVLLAKIVPNNSIFGAVVTEA